MSLVLKWSQKCYAERISKYKQEVINKEKFLSKYPELPFSSAIMDEVMNLNYGYEHPIADDDFPNHNIQWNENIFYGYKQISYYKYIKYESLRQCTASNSVVEQLEDIPLDREHSPSIDEQLEILYTKEPPATIHADVTLVIPPVINDIEDIDQSMKHHSTNQTLYKKQVDVEMLTTNENCSFRMDQLEICSFANKEMRTARIINHWFPIWIDGVCRVVAQIKNPGNKLYKPFMTGAILSYSQSEQLLTTLDCSYKFTDPINLEFMGKYVKFLQEKPLELVGNFDGDNWLKYTIKLSLLCRNGFLGITGKSTIKLLGSQRSKFIKTVMRRSRWKRQFKMSHKAERPMDYISICEELETIACAIEESGDWLAMLQKFLLKYGECANMTERFAGIDSLISITARPTDLNVSQESISYEAFSIGEKFNSTFTNLDVKLVLWSVTRNSIGQFCIGGLKLSNTGSCEGLIEIDPVPIVSVMNNGKAVIADRCCYELLGPMYSLSVRLAAPSAAAVNIDYIWPLLTHFTDGLPLHWKRFSLAIDALCRCSPLRHSTELSLAGCQGAQLPPLCAAPSPSVRAPIPVSPPCFHRHRESLTTVSHSGSVARVMLTDVRLDKRPIVTEKATSKINGANIHHAATSRSILDIPPVAPQQPTISNHEQPLVSPVGLPTVNTRKRKTESSHPIETSDRLQQKRIKLQNQGIGKKKSNGKVKKKCSFAFPLNSVSNPDLMNSRSVSRPSVTNIVNRTGGNKPNSNNNNNNRKMKDVHQSRIFPIDFNSSRNKFDSSQYMEYLSLNEIFQVTRSGRKSMPPLDPRFDVEYKIENDKVFLLSKCEKIELMNRLSYSQK